MISRCTYVRQVRRLGHEGPCCRRTQASPRRFAGALVKGPGQRHPMRNDRTHAHRPHPITSRETARRVREARNERNPVKFCGAVPHDAVASLHRERCPPV